MHESNLVWTPGETHGQTSWSSWGRFRGPHHLTDNLPPNISTAAAPCVSQSPGSHQHLLGAGGWHATAASPTLCLTARGTWTGIPRILHRHHDMFNMLGKEVTPQRSQQSQASCLASNSALREHCSCCLLLLCNLFVLQLLLYITTLIVVDTKASPAVGTHLCTLLRTCTSDCKDLTVKVHGYFTSL